MDSKNGKHKEIILFSHPSMFDLARKIEKSYKECKFTVKLFYKEQGINWNKFQDGFPDLFINDVKEISCKHVFLLVSFHSPDVIFEQMSLIYALPRYMVKSLTVILPYFPTGTMERIDLEGQIPTAKTLATMLSMTPLSLQGPVQLIVYDIHAIQERFYFSDGILPRLETALFRLEDKLAEMLPRTKLIIAFPDEGAFKRFNPWLNASKKLESLRDTTVVFKKRRNGNERKVRITQGCPKGYHVVIVDDLVQSGGTLIECAKELKVLGATEVSAYVTHAVFPQESWKRFTEGPIKFSNFWITDSIPHANQICKISPFQLLSLDKSICLHIEERCF